MHATTETSAPTLHEHIPVRLKALRTALGLSASALDRQAGFPAGTTRRLERGELRIYGAHLYRVSQVTGMPISFFFGLQSTGDELEKQHLLQAYMKISNPCLKRDVFELIESLANQSDMDEI